MYKEASAKEHNPGGIKQTAPQEPVACVGTFPLLSPPSLSPQAREWPLQGFVIPGLHSRRAELWSKRYLWLSEGREDYLLSTILSADSAWLSRKTNRKSNL